MSKQEAFEEIRELKQQIEESAEQLRLIMREEFPDQYHQGDAYGVFDCVGSSNPYDVTIESLLDGIVEENEEIYS